MKLEHVFEPFQLGRLTARNRIFVPAHTTNFGADHLPTARHVAYHRARAGGGAAMIMFEAIRVMENSLGRPQGVAGFLREGIPAYRSVADAVHQEGALFLAQICHLGRQIEGEFERTCSYGPSPIRWSPGAYPPREMSRTDMDAVIGGHLRTTDNMLEAGFDGIELHWGHGHLLQQFLSPMSNRRSDEYGGALENRMRFPLQVVKAIRSAIGAGVCLGVRFSAEEFVPEGLHLEEATEMARRLVAEVEIDFIHVTHSAYHMSRSLGMQMADMGVDKATFRHLPGAIRTAVANAGRPVAILAVCKYRDLAEADAMIGSGAADMIGMARAHIADPMIVAKWKAGREDEVRPCIGCNQGCAQNLERNLPITCFVNPMAGREGNWHEDDPATESRRVVVVGGGPAGIEAAAVAASRGHRVTLLERGGSLGGRLRLAAGLRLREDFGNWLEFSGRRLARLGVEIHLRHEATAQSVRGYDPEAVVLATGAAPVAFTLADGTHALTLDEAAQTDFAGGCVLVYDETGDWGAMGLVEHLAEQGAKVTLATPVAGVLWRTTVYSSTTTLARWREKGIRIKTLRRPSGFSPRQRELLLEDVSTGEPEIVSGVDALVACVPPQARHALEQPLIAAGIMPVLVGDCLAPRNALEAIFEGHRAARAF